MPDHEPTPAATPPGTSRRRFLGAAGAAAGVGAVLGLTGLPSRALAAPAAPTAARVYQPTWDSVNRHPAAPTWFQDAKFGIYFHWGAFSVPAYGSEWYPRRMYDPNDDCNAHHKQVYGDPVTRFPYNKFIDGGRDLAGNRVQFAPKLKSAGGKFDPDDWASLFLAAGAKYAGPVAEHHDGFSMWASKVNPWNSVQKGPKLDLVGLHEKAIRAKGLKFMVAMHHAYNFNGYFEYAPQQTDTTLQQLFGQLPRDQENQLWTARLQELIDGYQPDFIYHDFDLVNVDESERLNYLAYYFNAGVAQKRDVLTTYKDGFNLFGEVFDYERGGPADINRPYWSTDDSISSSSWCYTEGIGYYSPAQMVHSLIDRVSKGGTMTLNIAPQADGTIPDGQRSVLLDIGGYLRDFGEAVYDTRSWVVYGEGPTKMGGGYFVAPITGTADDTRFTVSKDGTTLYATVLGYPGSAKTISTLALGRFATDSLAGVELLAPGGSTVPVTIASQDGEGLHLALPSSAPFQAIAYVVRMRFSGPVPALRESGGAVFDEPEYAAPAAAVGVGRYTGDKLAKLLGGNVSISSISPTPGYRVTGWSAANFRGTSWTVTQDTPDLAAIGADNAIRSLEVTFDPAAFFRIASMSDTLLLDGGGASAPGSPLKRWNHDDPSPNMQWRIEDLGYGWFRLTNRTSGLVADGAGVAAGGTGVQNPWSGAGSQQWKLTDTGSGRFTIVNRATGLALASGGPQTAGAFTLLDTPRSATAQQWELRAV